MSLISNPLLSDKIERKFIDTLPIDDYEILTDTGWEDLTHINVTIPYDEYEVRLNDGKSMICADTHIFFDKDLSEVFAKDCSDIKIQTIDGPILVNSIIKNGKQSNMFDLSVNSDNHRYYTNDILSHNSATSVAWLFWYIIFNADKQVGILANKGAISREMLSRLTMMLENLPFWLQPGCKVLNKGSIKFSHNSEILAAATSSSSIRGKSLNCVTGDTKICISNDNSISYTTIEKLYTNFSYGMKVKTKDGFKGFAGVLDQGFSEKMLSLYLSNGEILNCTHDHKVLLNDGISFVESICLKVNDILYPNIEILDIFDHKPEKVYDLLNVKDTYSYFTNGIISHNCILLDEFAHVFKADEFYSATYPVITSGTDVKVIIASTPNGVGNMFYKIWEGAIQGTNNFKPFRVTWQEVPGHDEEWKRQTIANTSIVKFSQEFDCEFIGSAQTLISSSTLLGLTSRESIKQQYGIKHYIEPIEDHAYIMTVDVSKGRGQDYSTFSVFDITQEPFKQVCTFRDNLISPLIFPELIVRAAKIYNEAVVVIENNDAGQVVCNAVYHDYEYDNTFVQSSVKASGIGVTMTKRVKRIGCSNLKDLLEQGKLEVYDADTIIELTSFEPKGDSYSASGSNHDDMVMNLVLFAWFVSTDAFGNISTIDLKSLLYAEKIREMEGNELPFAIMTSNHDGYSSLSMEYYEKAKADMTEWGQL